MIIRITGGLGNQMFQYAFAKAIQRKQHIKNLQLDVDYFEENKIHNGFELKKIFDINECYYRPKLLEKIFNKVVIKIGYLSKLKCVCVPGKIFEISLGFFPELETEDLSNSYIDGYWQSEDYFYEDQDYIREIFKFPQLNDDKNKKVLKLIEETNSVSLHVRRGDYLSSSRYICLGQTDYYQQAIEYINQEIDNVHYFIFSDDIEWCRQNLHLPLNSTFIDWNKNENSYIDLQLMSLCKHNIIANSSFSWWGAWLNKNENKVIISPDHFYRKTFGYDDSHLVPSNWKKIQLDL